LYRGSGIIAFKLKRSNDMAVTTQSSAPYTAGSALIGLIRRFREKGLTTPITADVLIRAGVSESLVPRTLQSLVILELIDDAGQPTPTFKKMRTVPEAEYKACLAEWIQSVYADVLSFVDPATDDAVRVRDAFRAYTPHGQQDRMVALFLSLCAEAGLAPEGKKSESRGAIAKRTVARLAPLGITRKSARTTPPADNTNTLLPPALAGLLRDIPSPATGWTQPARDKFLATFGTLLDYFIPIKSEAEMLIADDAEAES
jgi:hypothetical protein